VVVAGAEVSAGVGMADKKGERNDRSVNHRGLGKNFDQRRELNEDIDLW
jgi:hypothetical protein